MTAPKEPPVARRLLDPANLLSLVRLPMAGVVWLRPEDPIFVTVLLALAGVSDMLDGAVARWLARRRHEAVADSGHMGAWLDPACDKVFVVSAALAILWAHTPPLWVIAVLLSRDVLTVCLLAAFALRYGREGLRRADYHAVYAGKATTVLQFAAVLAVLYWPPATVWLAVACGVTGLVAVAQVTARTYRQAVRA